MKRETMMGGAPDATDTSTARVLTIRHTGTGNELSTAAVSKLSHLRIRWNDGSKWKQTCGVFNEAALQIPFDDDAASEVPVACSRYSPIQQSNQLPQNYPDLIRFLKKWLIVLSFYDQRTPTLR